MSASFLVWRRAATALAIVAGLAWSAVGIAQQVDFENQPAQVGQPAQPPVNAAINGFGPNGVGNGIGNGNGNGNGGNNGFGFPGGLGNGGGAASADFDSLIDLITSTVERETWQENGTGEGEIQPFPTGVWADAAGNLRVGERPGGAEALASVRKQGTTGATAPRTSDAADPAHDARKGSKLRYVSLPRLEAAIAQRQAAHMPLDPAMLTLGGLERIEFVLAYPETGDLVLAGPAGDWKGTREGLVDPATGRPLVRLDDLIALWRRQVQQNGKPFGCKIVPRQEALARVQDYLASTAGAAIDASERKDWLAGLRDSLGVQDVEFMSIDPNTRISGLLLAADYHMKLVGMGLADGVPGVKSYLSTVRLGPGGQAPPMAVLRWWFSIPTSNVEASPEHDAFALPAKCVQVLSENELLEARGQRVHTGQSDALNSQFAKSFTDEFAALADKYPIYGELSRVFELSLALAVIQKEGLAEKVGWNPSLLLDGERLRLPRVAVPKGVETVINHRVIGGRQIIAGVSGGVWVDGGKSLTIAAAGAESATALASMRKAPAPAVAAAATTDAPDAKSAGTFVWWWD